jgi:glycosyltransferase involved in cell wall biosynthesis
MKFFNFLYHHFFRLLLVIQRFASNFFSQSDDVCQPSIISMVWVGSYPSHYMSTFHRQLEVKYGDLFFLYIPFGQKILAFSHEQTLLPKRFALLSQYFSLIQVWFWLGRLNPRTIVISGTVPRANLVAACWAYLYGREYCYLADSNLLDYRNLNRSLPSTLILRWLLRRANKLLSIGSRNREFYLSILGKEHISKHLHFMPLPHLYQPFEAVPLALPDPFTFLVFGRLEAVKGVDRIISAFGLLSAESQHRSRLLIAGDGVARSTLQAQAALLGLTERVEFRGMVRSDQAAKVFGEANAMIIASYDEPWGLVVNEALSAGKPVIGPFWIGAFADLVIHGRTGLVTADNSPEQLALAMQQMLEDPLTAQVMGEAGRILVREQGWTIDGSLASFEALIYPKNLKKF